MNVKPQLSKEDIQNALGKSLGVSAAKLEMFSSLLVNDLRDMMLARDASFPKKQVMSDFIASAERLQTVLEEVSKSSEEHPFIGSIMRLSSRHISKKKYRPTDLQDAWALIKLAKDWARHVRFQNKNKGPDTRFALELAFTVAEYYKKYFGKIPGVSGGGKRGNRADATKFQLTPYQRVCDAVAQAADIKIGRPVQEEAVSLLKAKKRPSPWFSADVHSLPEKKID